MGIARYAQNSGRRSARRVGIKDRYSLRARKLTKAKKINDTVRLTTIATVKMRTITHQVLTRWDSSLKLRSGFSRRSSATNNEAMTSKPKIPASVHCTTGASANHPIRPPPRGRGEHG